MAITRGAKFLLLFSSCFILSGCSTGDLSLRKIDDRIGQLFNDYQNKEQAAVIDIMEKKGDPAAKTAADLTAAQKKDIDAWLEKKGLNRYGDAANAVYKGGTPLVDEKTGKAIERYDYILNKFPDILERLERDK